MIAEMKCNNFITVGNQSRIHDRHTQYINTFIVVMTSTYQKYKLIISVRK